VVIGSGLSPCLAGGYIDPITNRWVYTLSVSAGHGGTVTSPGIGDFAYLAGTSVSLSAAPDPGYAFSHWSGDVGDSKSPSTSITLNGDASVSANFVSATLVTLSVSAGEGGSIVSPGEGSFKVRKGSTVSIEAAPLHARYLFKSWSGSGHGEIADSSARRTSVLVDGDYSLSADFALLPTGPSLGYSLGEMDYVDPCEVAYRVTTNTTSSSLFVELIDDPAPDVGAALRMRVINGQPARAKVRFGQCDVGRLLLRFQYLLETLDPVQIIVYVSDVPEMLDHGDPARPQHYLEVGRVLRPPAGRPGSIGSGRFGTFESWVDVGSLDLSQGTWIELELIVGDGVSSLSALTVGGLTAAAASGAMVGRCAVEVHCTGYCMDLNWSDSVGVDDFLLMIGANGTPVCLDNNGNSGYCLEGPFSNDGYVDPYDMQSWVWALKNIEQVDCPNLCRVPLPLTSGGLGASSTASPAGVEALDAAPLRASAGVPADLLILGKARMSSVFPDDLLRDCLCLFDDLSNEDRVEFVASYATTGAVPTHGSTQVVRGPGDDLYLVNTEQGLLRIDGSVRSVVPPGKTSVASEPRYRRPATVYVGMQGGGEASFGRPILDAAVMADRVYVVPVVVQPAGQEAYLAAAQLEPDPGANPPYRVVVLYDEPCLPNENQRRNHLREIEVDRAGNVYVLNVHRLNESCILWKYIPGDSLLLKWRLDLQAPAGAVKIEAPLGMHVSHDGQTLYVASGQNHGDDPNDTTIYALSTLDGALQGTTTIRGMQLATSITEAPATRTLWVAGFRMPDILEWKPKPGQRFIPNPAEPFYVPFLAEVPWGKNDVTARCIADPAAHKLALPTAVIWTGPRK